MATTRTFPDVVIPGDGLEVMLTARHLATFIADAEDGVVLLDRATVIELRDMLTTWIETTGFDAAMEARL